MKIALVHDYLNEFGGAERVLLALSEIYPQAPIYTIYARKSSKAYQEFKDKKIVESWFACLPFSDKLISPLRFLVPFIWGTFDFKDFDLVITSASWGITKGMRNAKLEICYLHTPPRYLYGYETSRNWQNKWYGGLVKIYALIVNHFLRIYDFKKAQTVDYFIVNSQNVGQRVEKFYRRKDYQVIYPPVEIKKFLKIKEKILKAKVEIQKNDYYLTGGRMTAAKNFDLIIKACQKAEVVLKIFGTGVEEKNLKKLAGKNVHFLGSISDQELTRHYQGAKAFILAQKDEDFGITSVEAAAAGTPVVAYRGGGYLESITEGKTGVFFDELTVESLTKVIKRFNQMKWDKRVLQNHAKKFSNERFKIEIKDFVKKHARITRS